MTTKRQRRAWDKLGDQRRHRPLNAEQQKLVDDYLRTWNIVGLVEKSMPSTARLCRRAKMTDDDILSAGYVAVVRASQTYEPDGRATFSTYASHWIKGIVQREAINQLRDVGRGEGEKVFGDKTDFCRPDKINREAYAPEQPCPLETEECVAAVRRILGTVQKRYASAMTMRKGIGCREHTLKEAAKKMRISMARVRQIELRAMRKFEKAAAEDESFRSAFPEFQLYKPTA